ncbi:MAG: TIR domain-containing protein [Candidatus Gorgyraea atricola]|nr:TIR domain-containing protein [Candidatus Gorgyraea atricola]
MAKKKVFVSFDYDHDKRYKYLLEAWDANPDFDFVFDDKTPEGINTNNIDRIKTGLTLKIKEATHTLFIVGEYANQVHKDRELIGFKNWMNFEAHQSIEEGNKLAVVKLDGSYEVPEELIGSGYWWIAGFKEENVIEVLGKALSKRLL